MGILGGAYRLIHGRNEIAKGHKLNGRGDNFGETFQCSDSDKNDVKGNP